MMGYVREEMLGPPSLSSSLSLSLSLSVLFLPRTPPLCFRCAAEKREQRLFPLSVCCCVHDECIANNAGVVCLQQQQQTERGRVVSPAVFNFVRQRKLSRKFAQKNHAPTQKKTYAQKVVYWFIKIE